MKLYIFLIIIILLRVVSYQSPFKNGDKVRVTGNVNREPVVYDHNRQVEVAGIRAYIPKYPEVLYGDSIIIEGTVQDGVVEDPEVIQHKQSSSLLYILRNKILGFYQQSLPEPHSSLVAGVVLGSKSGMSSEFWEDLRNSGTAHVVVASGMNVTLVGGFLLNVLVGYIDRKKAIIGVIIGIWLYAFLAGMDAPIIRAAIMGSIAFSAQAVGRINMAMRALLISAALMLIINPLWIRDLGYQLSFTATASLILFESKVERLIRFVPPIIRQDLATTLAAQIGVTPILVYYFNSMNLISPFVNAIVLWTIPVMTIGGMLAGIVSLFVPLLGKLILILIYPLTYWFVMIVRLVA